MPKPVMQANKLLVEHLARCFNDPLLFVCTMYEWGKGEGVGPDSWQADVLDEIRDGMAKRSGPDAIETALRIAATSGHGIGKSALVAWIIQWFLATRPHPQAVITANTKQQLEQKTWRELAKWHKNMVPELRALFEWTASKFYLREHPDTWFAAAVPWSAERSEAFAGTHEEHVLMIFDEASLIDDKIWEVAEGALTTKGAIWIAFGNPTRNTGRFHDCFGKQRDLWKTRQIDSRTAKMTNKHQIQEWVNTYGEDSDFVRVRVKGVFPRVSVVQFIGNEIVEQAARRVITEAMIAHAPVVMGGDVARFGDDSNVLYVRRGFATLAVEEFREVDSITLGGIINDRWKRYNADAVFIDVVGIGAGVVDYLKSIGRDPIPVNAGNRAVQDKKYANVRAEMWDAMRTWLVDGGSIPADNRDLQADLISPKYGYDAKGRLLLESKRDMKARGEKSPDFADALSHTFAAPVARKDYFMGMANVPKKYDPFTYFDGRYC